MRRTHVLIVILLAALDCGAQDWSGYGLKAIAEKQQGKQTIYVVSDQYDQEYSIISDAAPKEAELRKILNFIEIFRKWTIIKGVGITFVVYPSEVEMNIKVSNLVYKDIDFVPYLSAGIGFFHANSLTYNFRLSINHTYPKVAGVYGTEVALCEAMLAAFRSIEPAAVKTTARGETSIPFVPPPVPAKADPPPAPETPEAVKSPVLSLEDQEAIISLKNEVEKLKLDNAGLRADLERLRKAVLVLENLGLFGSVRPLSTAGIERILALKKEKPSLLQDEVAELLRKENIKMTSYEIFLVFSIYLNEFR